MSSGFPGGGGIYGSFGIGGRSAGGSPIQVPYQRSDDGGSFSPKRPLTEMERQQLQQALFIRSVKQRTLHHHQTSPISPIPTVDFSSSFPASSSPFLSPSSSVHPATEGPAVSCNTTTSGTTSSSSLASRNGSYLFLQQQLLLQQQQKQRQLQLQLQANGRVNAPDFSVSPSPLTAAPQQTDPEKATTMKNRLQELERRLLDDDEDEDSGSAVTTTSDWNETMQSLISPSNSPSSGQKPPSPSPSSTSSSSSTCSSCSPSSLITSRQMLLDSASAIADGNFEAATANLDRLKLAANPRGDPDQRLTTYMVSALLSRINPPPPEARASLAAELCSAEHLKTAQLLYESSPCFGLSLAAANLAILEATRGHPKIHIVDFDIGQGLQYRALVSALASAASSGRPTVKITAVADPTSPSNPARTNSGASSLKMVGDRLLKQAGLVGVSLQFNVVCRKTSDLDRSALGCEPDEALAVNFAFLLHRMADESVSPENPRDELLRRVKALVPRVVTLVEQEMSTNTAPFAARLAEASGYYRAVFESLDAALPRDSADRARLEECLGRKAANAVAREGRERVERCEVFGKWRARMGMAGFQPSPLAPVVAESLRARLAGLKNNNNNNNSNPGFTLKEEAGGVCLGWMGRVLTVASAWH